MAKKSNLTKKTKKLLSNYKKNAKQLNYQEKPKKISEKTKKEIEQARTDIKAGKFYTHAQVKERLGLG